MLKSPIIFLKSFVEFIRLTILVLIINNKILLFTVSLFFSFLTFIYSNCKHVKLFSIYFVTFLILLCIVLIILIIIAIFAINVDEELIFFILTYFFYFIYATLYIIFTYESIIAYFSSLKTMYYYTIIFILWVYTVNLIGVAIFGIIKNNNHILLLVFLAFLWTLLAYVIGVAVLYRIINRYSFFCYAAIMYYITYIGYAELLDENRSNEKLLNIIINILIITYDHIVFYLIFSNFNILDFVHSLKKDIVKYLKKNISQILKNLKMLLSKIKKGLKRFLFKALQHFIENIFIALTLILIFVYVDAYCYSVDKVIRLLLGKFLVTKEYFTWWEL